MFRCKTKTVKQNKTAQNSNIKLSYRWWKKAFKCHLSWQKKRSPDSARFVDWTL